MFFHNFFETGKIMSIKAGLIGVGGYGRIHFTNLKELVKKGMIELAAAVVYPPGSDPEAAAELQSMNTRIFDSADDLFREMKGKLQLICIPTGIALHEPMTIQALAAGANVLVEKPASGSVAGVLHMKEAEEKSTGHHFVAIGFQHIYAKEIHSIKRTILSGRIGKIRAITVRGLWPRNDAYYHRNNWAGKCRTASGEPIFDSPINNAFAHYLNLPLFLAGENFEHSAHAEEIQAELYKARPEIETFDTCGVRIRTQNKVEILALFSHATEQNRNPKIDIECENGTVLWQADGQYTITDQQENILECGKCESPVADQFERIVRKITRPEEFTCTLDIALEHTRCIENLHRFFQTVPITAEFAERRESDGQYMIRDIDLLWERCAEKNLLPSEAGAPWGIGTTAHRCQ